MFMLTRFTVVTFVLLCAAASAACIAQPQTDQPATSQPSAVDDWEPEGPPALRHREKNIEAELAGLDRAQLKQYEWAKEWAGTYYVGDGLGVNILIELAPKSGVTYTSHGCMGLYDYNHGDVGQSFPGGLTVNLESDPRRRHCDFMSSK